jgi:hypothetical protein
MAGEGKGGGLPKDIFRRGDSTRLGANGMKKADFGKLQKENAILIARIKNESSAIPEMSS